LLYGISSWIIFIRERIEKLIKVNILHFLKCDDPGTCVYYIRNKFIKTTIKVTAIISEPLEIVEIEISDSQLL